jgi:hypothetical protein
MNPQLSTNAATLGPITVFFPDLIIEIPHLGWV